MAVKFTDVFRNPFQISRPDFPNLTNMFLKNQHFRETTEVFKKECALAGCEIPDGCDKLTSSETETSFQCDAQKFQYANTISDANKREAFIVESSFLEASNCDTRQTENTDITHNKLSEEINKNCDFDLNLNKDVGVNTDSHSVKTLKHKFLELQEEHKKLIAVTAELTNALQLNVMGQAKNICYVLDQCQIIYPGLFVSHVGQTLTTPRDKDSTRQNGSPNMGDQQGTCEDYREKLIEHAVDDLGLNLTVDINHVETEENIVQNEEEGKPQCSPISERDIQDILEAVFSKAMQYFNETGNSTERDCCDIGKACSTCQGEISKIIESVLVKVMETPRCGSAPRSASIACGFKNKINSYRSQAQTSNRHTSPKDSSVEGSHLTNTFNSTDDNQEKSVNYKNVKENSKIDYDYLKNGLLKNGVEEKRRILQTLRWGLTKSKAEDTEKTLDSYILNDILDIHEKHPLPEMLCVSDSPTINEGVFRLINAIASLRQGREYLAANDKMLKLVLLPKFMENYSNTSPITNDMVIATLQKLSLQKHARIWMLDEGLLDYLIVFLKESSEILSPYSSERCMALLMNLCSMDRGKEYCIRNTEKIVDLIKELLKREHPCCLPFVNGTMLSVLSYDEVKAEAKKQQLDQLLHQLVKNTRDEYARRQLSFIIQSRFSEELQCFIGDDDESSQKHDVLEIELDTDSGEEVDFEEKQADIAHNEETARSTNRGTSVASINKITKIPIPIQKDTKKKKIIQKFFPRSSFCYLEICHGSLEGTCSCTKCVPSQNRYSCGCYDVICREVEEEINESYAKAQVVSQGKYVYKMTKTSDLDETEKPPKTVAGQCLICGDKVCDCAFESRPKIHRTPPES